VGTVAWYAAADETTKPGAKQMKIIDEMIDEAIVDIVRYGGPLTSANIADIACDSAATEETTSEEADQLWHQIDMRVRDRFGLYSDGEQITKLTSKPT
jgi:hypothetical protein